MKLGIVVVYMVQEQHDELLALHLDRIRRHTRVPYSIHGCPTRILHPRFRERLEARNDVVLHDLGDTPLRGAREHSWYLDRLVRAALADGVTHVVTLHVDSFPVAGDWVERLRAQLTPGRAFVTMQGIDTACLFFAREFHESHSPGFFVSESETSSPEYGELIRRRRVLEHSGTGYALAAWRAGLDWGELVETGRREWTQGPGIHGGIVFHLQGAVRLGAAAARPNPPLVEAIGRGPYLHAAYSLRRFVPRRLRSAVRPLIGRLVRRAIVEPENRWAAEAMPKALDQLVADPEGYLTRLGAPPTRSSPS